MSAERPPQGGGPIEVGGEMLRPEEAVMELVSDEEQSAGVWLIRVAWGVDHLRPRHREALLQGCDGPGAGPALAKAYGKLRRKVERRFGQPCPESLTKYVRALRRLTTRSI